jgi:hypothetical protein
VLTITAAGRRETRRHNEAQEKKVQQTLPPGMTAVVWETVTYRVWVRCAWKTNTGAVTLHLGPLGSDKDYEEVREAFLKLVPWLPASSFTPVNLAKAVAALHESAEREQADGATAEVRLQGLNYLTGGVRSNASSRAARQSILIDRQEVVEALGAFRDHGIAQTGNCCASARAARRRHGRRAPRGSRRRASRRCRSSRPAGSSATAADAHRVPPAAAHAAANATRAWRTSCAGCRPPD